jgi:hypothetical protein
LKFQSSLANDPDLRIVSKLTNFLFLTVNILTKRKATYIFFQLFKLYFKINKNSADIQWANPSVVGDPNNPTYNGLPVIVSTLTLQAFASYMESKSQTFPFTYDRAVGIFSKDLWSSSAQAAASRSAVVGFANIPGLCNGNRYAINEEYGGFQYVTVVAHEMGHK